MNNIDPKTRFQELSEFFTSDAWQLIESFLNNLQTKVSQSKIEKEEYLTLMNGIIDFIQEFSEDYKSIAKITFNDTLGLIQDIGSPSNILQSMDLPIDQIITNQSLKSQQEEMKGIRTHNQILCQVCNRPNKQNSLFCDNCGTRILRLQETVNSNFLVQLIRVCPNLMSILLCYGALLAYAAIIGIIVFTTILENHYYWLLTTYIPAAIAITFMPAVVFGLIYGYFVERLYNKQKYAKIPLEILNNVNITSIIISYLILLVIGFFESVIVFILSGYDETFFITNLYPILIAIMIIPAVCFGLIIGYLIDRLNKEQRLSVSQNLVETKKLWLIPQEVINSPYITSFLFTYLILIFSEIFIITIIDLPFSRPYIEYIPNFDIYISNFDTYISNFDTKLNSLSMGLIIPAIFFGLLLGFIIRRFFPKKFIQYRYDVHLTNLQKYFFFGILITSISICLCLVYMPVRVSRYEFILLVISLTIISILIITWIYKWNLEFIPYDIPYIVFLKHLKALENDNKKKIKKYNLIGCIIIFFIVKTFWSSIMTYSVFDIPGFSELSIPAWVVLILSLIMLLNGILLMTYYSWKRINRFIQTEG